MPRGTNAPKLWPAEPVNLQPDRVVGQALGAVPLRHLVAEHRADRAVHVANRERRARPASRCSSASRALRDQLVVERVVQPVILLDDLAARRVGRRPPAGRGWPRSRAPSPSSDRPPCGSSADRRARSSRPSSGSRAPPCTRALPAAMNRKKLTTNSGLPVKFLRSSGSCVATPTGQVFRWQTRIMMQPETTSGAVAKPNSSAPSSAAIDDVAAGLQLAVDLHDDAVAQAVHHQHLLRLGEPELPRHAAVLDRGERRRAGAAVVAGDQHDVGVRLRDAGGDRADAGQRDQLDVDPRLGVRVLQVVNQLREILDRVDVVVRRRRDQARRPASRSAPWRSTDRPCGRAAGRLRPAWRPAPS